MCSNPLGSTGTGGTGKLAGRAVCLASSQVLQREEAGGHHYSLPYSRSHFSFLCHYSSKAELNIDYFLKIGRQLTNRQTPSSSPGVDNSIGEVWSGGLG